MYNITYYHKLIINKEITIAQNERKSIHGQWSSKILFIFAATGSAVGLGNIWKFPWMAAENGGGAFVIVYLASVALIALPIMIAEILIGRRGKQNPVNSLRYLSKEASQVKVYEVDHDLNRTKQTKYQHHNQEDYTNWELIGWMGVISGIIILSFYSVIAGWTISYIFQSFSGSFNQVTVDGATNLFKKFTSDAEKQLAWHTIFMFLTCYIVSKGVRGGLEKAIKFLIPGLFMILLILTGYVTTLSGFTEGIRYLFLPDLNKITASVVWSAMGMAFFSLSIGMGALMIYGSYLSNKFSILEVTSIVAFADTFVAVLAGVIIFPIVFTYHLDPTTAGPGLIFQTLPIAFGSMPGGETFGALFFILLFFAAITSAISLIEPAVTLLIENFRYTRAEASLKIGFVTWLVGIGTIWSFNIWQDFTIFGMTFFNLLDVLTSKVLLPLGGFSMAIFVGYLVKRRTSISELKMSQSMYVIWRVLIRYIAPVAVMVIFTNGFM